MFNITEILLALTVIVLAWAIIRTNEEVRKLSIRLDMMDASRAINTRKQRTKQVEATEPSWQIGDQPPAGVVVPEPPIVDIECPNCGREYQSNSSECPFCGAENLHAGGNA
jgi:hypothetical protein